MTERAEKKSSRRPLWREYRNFAIFAFLLLAFRSAWADWVHVPTGSMNPTILEGDRLLVDKRLVTREELEAVISAIDREDGTEDGQFKGPLPGR